MTNYDIEFYGEQSPGSEKSASEVLPILFELHRPTSIVDVGCGVGTWLKVAKGLGVPDIVGIDGAYARSAGLRIPDEAFIPADLAKAVPELGRRMDVAMSLEVAEHLPPDQSDRFVRDLCRLADLVMFSAAVPTQLGTDHINLQPQSAWVDRFRSNGYEPFDLIRPRAWANELVEVWYRQNIIVYVNASRHDLVSAAASLDAGRMAMWDVVHPELVAFWHRRATRPISTGQGARLTSSAAMRALRRRLHR